MKCTNCQYIIALETIPDWAWCKAPAGRYHNNQALKVDLNIERDCKLFKSKLVVETNHI